MTRKTLGLGVLALLIIIGGAYYLSMRQTPTAPATSFAVCAAAGGLVAESYPRQCTSKDGTHFTEDIGNELEKTDVIQVSSPRPNAEVSSPLNVSGQARGSWFFEGSFPVLLTDFDGNVIAQGAATAKEDWMTSDFVPFEATLTFISTNTAGQDSNKGTLILEKDNPSGLPQNADKLEIPVLFASTTSSNQGIAPFHSGIRGTVTLGPTCPVAKNPPDPKCADKPYQTTVSVSRTNSTQVFATVKSDASGSFEISLPPGSYVVNAESDSLLPHCAPMSVTVSSTDYSNVTVSCDTGIR